MLTFFILFFNHLAFLRYMEHVESYPSEHENFKGIGRRIIYSIPVDGFIAWLLIQKLL